MIGSYKKPDTMAIITRVVLWSGAMLFMACASSPHLHVDYQVTPAPADWAGKRAYMTVRDVRPNTEILQNGAKTHMNRLSGLFSLSINRGRPEAETVGVLNAPVLLKKVLERRLATRGVLLTQKKSTDHPVIQIDIRTFSLDLVDRKWVAVISYTATCQ